MSSTNTRSQAGTASAESPVLNVTSYDRVSSWMIAVVVGLILAVAWLTVVWATNRIPEKSRAAPIEMIDLPGGEEEGAVDETLKLESPAEESLDPSLAETIAEQSEIQEVLETVVEMADQASSQAQQQFELDARNAGKPGSASGTGRRALGMGAGEGGISREQRWFIRFGSQGTLDEYVEQLQFFGIQLGALLPDGRLVYLSNLDAAQPTTRTVTSGSGEDRLYMTWRGGNRQRADIQLLKKAGVDADRATILHFYPPETEQMLLKLERDYRNRPVEEIRRTYFLVRRSGSGYRFMVTKQAYLR